MVSELSFAISYDFSAFSLSILLFLLSIITLFPILIFDLVLLITPGRFFTTSASNAALLEAVILLLKVLDKGCQALRGGRHAEERVYAPHEGFRCQETTRVVHDRPDRVVILVRQVADQDVFNFFPLGIIAATHDKDVLMSLAVMSAD